jgi:hypothetical protein
MSLPTPDKLEHWTSSKADSLLNDLAATQLGWKKWPNGEWSYKSDYIAPNLPPKFTESFDACTALLPTLNAEEQRQLFFNLRRIIQAEISLDWTKTFAGFLQTQPREFTLAYCLTKNLIPGSVSV